MEEFAEAEKKPSRPYEGVPGERIDLVEFLSAAGVEILGEIPRISGTGFRHRVPLDAGAH